MKKIVCIMMSLVMFAALLSGCSQQEAPQTEVSQTETPQAEAPKTEGYSIKIFDFSDSIPGSKHVLEYTDWSQDPFSSTQAEKEVTVSVGDTQVQATYVETGKMLYEYYNTNSYKDQDNHSLSITEDGRLSQYFWGYDASAGEAGKVYTEEECLAIARDFLSDIVDVSDYSVQTKYDPDGGLYKFYFNKYVGGLLCADQARVQVEENGHIFAFSSNMLGRMPADDETSFDLDAIKAQVIARLDEEYAGVKDSYDDILYDNFQYTVTVDEEGQYLLVCVVDVSFVDYYDDVSAIMGERVSFVIQ